MERGRGLYEALIRAIAHQQLHGKAAEAILARFVALYPDEAFPSPDRVLDTDGVTLRGCGFSAAKLAAVQDICAKARGWHRADTAAGDATCPMRN